MYRVTVCPAAAQGILSPSYEITVVERGEPTLQSTEMAGGTKLVTLTFHDTGFIPRYDPQFLSSLDGTCAHPSRDASSGSRAFKDVRDGEPEG